ncbi:cytochrome P450 7A1-like [Gigantopelta aegis]|uniref:cytochrome P450 7A1-like n=1 Tax=Gigantopelta aegis TaxID=1735272 RepID=UPI001B88C65A|nr:cytochrome P450 7A1-like [Gigantopelta aegis]
MVAVTFYLAAVTVGLTMAYVKYLYRRRRENEPPLVPGNLLLGNGIEFGKHAVQFLHRCQKKFGDIFTIRLLNQHLTIVADPHSYEQFAKERKFDFDPIQRQVNHNIFSYELVDARKMLSEAGKKVNGRYLYLGLKNFSDNLKDAFQQVTTVDVNGNDVKTVGDQWGEDGLRNFTARTLFSALFYTIFGHGPAAEEFHPQVFHKNFDIFHKYFNYMWLGIGVKWFPKALEALRVLCHVPNSTDMMNRRGVSDYIKFSTQFMKENAQTEQDIVGHNLVFLHVNYNTFRAAFWCAYYIVSKADTYTALSKEVGDLVQERLNDNEPLCFTLEEIDHLPVLDSIIKETMRLTSGVFMVREIVEDTDFTLDNGKTYRCRQGDKAAIYPPCIHMDPEIFEDPEVFKYDRFVDAKFYKNGKELKNPLIAFGSLCPGKRYAMLQTKWFLMNLVNSFDIELLPGEETTPDTSFYGHEILPPRRDVNVKYRLKDNFHELEFLPRRSHVA